MEFAILNFIQTLRMPWLDSAMVFISSLGNAGAVWIVLTAVLLILPRWRRVGAILLCALVIDFVVCNGIVKPLVARPRPYDLNPAMDYLISRPHGWSFPSGHTAASFSAASALWFGKSALWLPCGVLALLIAFSRLYLYVHFPTDVLFGVLFGILFGWLASVFVRFVGEKRQHI